MKNLFIVGARGYHANYGGWETFVSNLVDNYKDKNTCIYVTELSGDEREDKVIKKISDNIYVIKIYIKKNGASKMFLYTMKAYLYILDYIKKNNIIGSYIYVLGLKLGPLLWFYKGLRRKNKINILVNPDGLEHMRSKWNKVIQFCFLLSEWAMVKHCDMVVCDALGIQEYIQKKYKKVKTVYIAYGADVPDLKEVDDDVILSEYGLSSNDYLLMVGRCVPENNYELVISEFMKSNIDKKLIIVSNLSSSNYYKELVKVTNCNTDNRIIFIDGIYDKIKLSVVRKNAYLYIHGHSVGGTNPSLIEALSLTDLNILYDVCFNKDIGLDYCLYFKDEESLVKLLNDKKLLDNSKKKFGKNLVKYVNSNFTWEIIVDKYKKLFR